jgi:replicative DNA helicase
LNGDAEIFFCKAYDKMGLSEKEKYAMASPQNITISLPENLLKRVRQVASERNRTIENTIIDVLQLLVGTSDEALDTQLSLLETTSDEQLWSIAQLSLSASDYERLRALIEKGRNEPLLREDERELDQLSEMSEYWMVLRSKALAILKQRGHNVEHFVTQAH